MKPPSKPKHRRKENVKNYWGRGRFKRFMIKYSHHRHRQNTRNLLKHETYDTLDQGNKTLKYFCDPWYWD